MLIPASVDAFLKDPGIRSATDALLQIYPYRLDNLTWEEVGPSLRAFLAAQQIRVEWAETLITIWAEIWHDLVPNHQWKSLSPDEQAKNWATDLDALWNWESFARVFKTQKAGFEIHLIVTMSADTGIQIGIGLFNNDGEALLTAHEGFVWDEDDEILYSEEGRLFGNGDIDLSSLRGLAQAAAQTAFQLAQSRDLGREGERGR